VGLVRSARAECPRDQHVARDGVGPRFGEHAQQIEEDGRVLEEGGKEIGGALGGLAGSLAGGVGKGGGHHEPEETPPAPTTEPTPPPASRAVSGELEIEAVPAPGAKPPAAAAPPEEGFVDIGTDPGLRAVRDEINATAEPLVDTRTPAEHLDTPMTQREARASARPYQQEFRDELGLVGGDVQAGHVNAVRHAPESGITPEDLSDPEGMMALHSRRDPDLRAEATNPDGTTRPAFDALQKARSAGGALP